MTDTSADTRRETDSIGAIDVPADAYWGAQTQRSLQNFRIGGERMPAPLIRALGIIKQAAARVNVEAGSLDAELGAVIDEAAGEVIAGSLDDHFPLVVWQTGSGTQSNMNANEVIANRACEIMGQPMGQKTPGPPQRPRQPQPVLPTTPSRPRCTSPRWSSATHLLLPALEHLQGALAAKSEAYAEIVKIGRTHLQDATPLTLGQEFSGYATQVEYGIERVRAALPRLCALAQGGTAVGNRAQHQGGFRRALRGRGRGAHRPPLPHRREQVRGHRRQRRGGRDVGRAQHRRRKPDEDRERHPAAGIGPALRARGAGIAGQRARLLDHAGQGQSDPGGGAHHGRGPGHGQSRRHIRGRRQRPLRAQRVQAGDDLQPAAVDPPDRRRRAQLHRQLRRRHRAEPRAHRPAAARIADAGDRAQPPTSATTTPPRWRRRPMPMARR